MVRITAKPVGGFWRCGVFHPAAPVEHAERRFTAGQWARLRGEGMLTVEEPVQEPVQGQEHTDEHGRARTGTDARRRRKAKA